VVSGERYANWARLSGCCCAAQRLYRASATANSGDCRPPEAWQSHGISSSGEGGRDTGEQNRADLRMSGLRTVTTCRQAWSVTIRANAASALDRRGPFRLWPAGTSSRPSVCGAVRYDPASRIRFERRFVCGHGECRRPIFVCPRSLHQRPFHCGPGWRRARWVARAAAPRSAPPPRGDGVVEQMA